MGPTVVSLRMAASFKRVIHWFRRDLRLTDNTALLAAGQAAQEIVPVYVISSWTHHHRWTGPVRQAFLCGCLESLAKNVETQGGRLVFRQGDAVTELLRLAGETAAEAIYCNRDLDPFGKAEEARLEQACGRAGLRFFSCKDHVLHGPGEVRTAAGEGFRVYTPYFRVWRELAKPAPGGKAGRLRRVEVASLDCPSLKTWGLQPAQAAIQAPGEGAARSRLREGIEGRLRHYAERRDFPDGVTTSRLSQDLRFGLISIREIYAKVWEARAAAPAAVRTSFDKFAGELAWREFYADLLENWPEVLAWEFNPQWRGLPWGDADARFVRWCRGKTGFPIVDAGMRELLATGFMHNRVRMIVAMFLTKDLRIDWRRGEQYFMQQLTDGEIASNNGGWQWSAGTGADAAPYFRIQNPWTQTARYDPEGHYIRRWVPELVKAPARALFTEPERGQSVRPGYVEPMVDHGEERRRTLEWFERHKNAPGRGAASKR